MKDNYDKDSILECYNNALSEVSSDEVYAAISMRKDEYENQREHDLEQEAIVPVQPVYYDKYDELKTVADTNNSSALIAFVNLLPDQAEKHNLMSVFHLLNSGKLTDRLRLAGNELRIATQMEPSNPRSRTIASIISELGTLNDKTLQNRWRET